MKKGSSWSLVQLKGIMWQHKIKSISPTKNQSTVKQQSQCKWNKREHMSFNFAHGHCIFPALLKWVGGCWDCRQETKWGEWTVIQYGGVVPQGGFILPFLQWWKWNRQYTNNPATLFLHPLKLFREVLSWSIPNWAGILKGRTEGGMNVICLKRPPLLATLR